MVSTCAYIAASSFDSPKLNAPTVIGPVAAGAELLLPPAGVEFGVLDPPVPEFEAHAVRAKDPARIKAPKVDRLDGCMGKNPLSVSRFSVSRAARAATRVSCGAQRPQRQLAQHQMDALAIQFRITKL